MVDISVVLFDLGNVLTRWDRRFLYSQLIPDESELDYFLDNVLTLEENAKLDRGTPLAEVSADLIRRFPEHQDLLQAFADRWSETVDDEPIAGSVQILEELIASGVRCIALSNWGWDTFEAVQHKFDFLELFDAKVISGYEGVVKPEPEIFNLAAERHGFEPSEAFFIDDSAVNVAAARNLGWTAHHFVSPDELRQDLTERGLLTRPEPKAL